MDGGLLDVEDEGDVNLDLGVLGILLDLGFSNISLIRAVFMSVAVSLNICSPKMK